MPGTILDFACMNIESQKHKLPQDTQLVTAKPGSVLETVKAPNIGSILLSEGTIPALQP